MISKWEKTSTRCGEPGDFGVSVTLTNTGSGLLPTTTDDANGKFIYQFGTRTYTVTFGTPAGGYSPNYCKCGRNDNTDSDGNRRSNRTSYIGKWSGDTSVDADVTKLHR